MADGGRYRDDYRRDQRPRTRSQSDSRTQRQGQQRYASRSSAQQTRRSQSQRERQPQRGRQVQRESQEQRTYQAPRSRQPQRGRQQQPYRQRQSARRQYQTPSRGPGVDNRIIIVVAAVVALIIVLFGVSRCASCSQSEPQTSQAAVGQASADASSVAASAEASSPAEQAESSGESASATSEAVQPAAEPRAIVNAQPGDVSYPVAQAAKLKFRDVDFAVDPSRTDWNYDKPNGHKTMYLTFDDGPSANTERVLDILDQYGCKATFFVTGQNPDYFGWIKEAYDRGHTIGLHSYSHDYGSCYSSPEGFWSEFDAIGQVVKDQIGYVPCFIRFPGGASNTVSADYSSGIMTYLADDVKSRGYQYYDWSLSCGDGSVHTAEELISYGCEPTDEENVVYLLHDGSAKETTAEALPSIIEYYQSQGYSFEAIDRSTLVYQHGVSN